VTVNDNNIPAVKTIFDAHSAVREKIEAANNAAVDALVAMVLQQPQAGDKGVA
jgi:hypothetical protein